MLSICDSILNHRFKKTLMIVSKCINNELMIRQNLQDSSNVVVDQSGDTLDTTTAGKTTNGRRSDTQDVVTKNLWTCKSACKDFR
jgi:hypothetical protein